MPADPFQGAQRVLGGGRDRGQVLVPGVERLPGGEGGPGAAGGQRGAVPAGDFLGQQRAEHLGRVPPLRFGGGQHLGGDAAHVRQPHPAQQLLQPGVQRRRGRGGGGHRLLRAAGREVQVVDGQVDVVAEARRGCGRLRRPGWPRPAPRGTAGRRAARPRSEHLRAGGQGAGGSPRSPRWSARRPGAGGAVSSGLPPARRAAPTRRCPGPGCAARRPGTVWPAAAQAWWARMAARSPSANRPAAAAWPERPVHRAGAVQGGQLHRLGHLGPHPGGARCGGLGQPQPGAVPDRQELRLGRRSAPSACGPARRAARAGSARRRPAGCPAWSPGAGPPRPGRPARHG